MFRKLASLVGATVVSVGLLAGPAEAKIVRIDPPATNSICVIAPGSTAENAQICGGFQW
jgi:hypothetical protein